MAAALRVGVAIVAIAGAGNGFGAGAPTDGLVVKTIAGLHGWPAEGTPLDEPAPTIAINKAGKLYVCSYRGGLSLLWEIDPGRLSRGIGYVDAYGQLHTNPQIDFKIRLFGERLKNIRNGSITRTQDEGPGFVEAFDHGLVATEPVRPVSLAVDPKGDVYVSSIPIAVDAAGFIFLEDHLILKRIAPNGTVMKLAGYNWGFKDGRGAEAEFGHIAQISIDPSGRILIGDFALGSGSNDAVRLVTPSGEVSTLVGPVRGASGYLMPSSLSMVQSIAGAQNGEVYVLEQFSPWVKVVSPNGSVKYLGESSSVAPRKFRAGWQDGPLSAAEFAEPKAIAVAPDGAVYVIDSGKFTGHWTIRRIAPGTVEPAAALSTTPQAPPERPELFRGVVTTIATGLGNTSALTIDHTGNVYVAITREDTPDPWSATIERLGPSGSRTIVAGTTANRAYRERNDHRFRHPTAIFVDPTSVIFVADYARPELVTQTLPDGEVYKSLLRNGTDLKPGTSMVLSKSGTTYLADTYRHIIRKVSPNLEESILAGSDGISGEMDGQGSAALFRGLGAIAVDGHDTVYAIDGVTIRRISADGNVTTLAGASGETGTADGPGKLARFTKLEGIAASAEGTVFVTDESVIRCIRLSGYVQTIAGIRRAPYEKFVPDSYDSGPVSLERARFASCGGLAVDGQDRVYVLDGDSVRRIELHGDKPATAPADLGRE